MAKKLVRPVFCMLCNKRMHYNSDPLWQPEMYIAGTLTGHHQGSGCAADYSSVGYIMGYAHIKCWCKKTKRRDNNTDAFQDRFKNRIK